jgi:hypothetical protein
LLKVERSKLLKLGKIKIAKSYYRNAWKVKYAKTWCKKWKHKHI